MNDPKFVVRAKDNPKPTAFMYILKINNFIVKLWSQHEKGSLNMFN